ncbi:CLI_3235 family bacteriocin precursor [Anaeromicropila populeti]|uniref:Putative bacteriocin, CLI_3235 family n=1 Tax=Anaeromicropila populeti TaxID=37658 RepID=A0A1I6ID96_9FIRM|nr:CLI_3235 family bacteriocin precursor [Anaeromicropila populeti]SFR64747.1 putative bacteriocin precursor, CLI_3235 family [Anaeromicropila populeti]
MKKLSKRNQLAPNTVLAFGCSCACSCGCTSRCMGNGTIEAAINSSIWSSISGGTYTAMEQFGV